MKILPICYVSSGRTLWKALKFNFFNYEPSWKAIDSNEKASREIFKFYNSTEFFKYYGCYLIILRKPDHLVKNLQSRPKCFEKIFH